MWVAEPDAWLGRYGAESSRSPRRTRTCSRCRAGSQPGSSNTSMRKWWPPVTNPFYSSEQAELSEAVLDDLFAAVPGVILIGGWGTWARVGGR